MTEPDLRALLDEAVEALDGALAMVEQCSITTGVCCCGDYIENHPSAMICGHSPVDHGSYFACSWEETARATLARIKEKTGG